MIIKSELMTAKNLIFFDLFNNYFFGRISDWVHWFSILRYDKIGYNGDTVVGFLLVIIDC